MAESRVGETLRNARLAASEGASLTWRALGKPWRHAMALLPRAPEQLLISPQDIRTADPTVASDIYAGYFAFAGKVVNAHGRSPFELVPASPAWAAGLAGFGWLRHLRAADTALARANARVLVEDFLSQAEANDGLPVWEPKVAARRLLAWLSQSPMILEGADLAFYKRFMKSLGRHAARLQCALGDGLRGEARLLAAIAIAELGLCSSGMARMQRRSTQLLADELKRQILPDGGHIGRNPQTLIDLLLDLLPLRQAYTARGLEAPPELLNAVDRMLPMLRLFRLGDGSLALFNGMGTTPPHMMAIVLAYDDSLAAAAINAPHSGYQRLEAGGAIVIMDTGAPPPTEFSDRAHAGQLSFEMSSEGQPFICNCGAPDESRTAMRAAARQTAAHSTLVVADTSSSRFASTDGNRRRLAGRVVAGPRKVGVSRQDSPEGPELTASHDGYAKEFGLIHQRAIRVAVDGSYLVGLDQLVATDAGRQVREAPNYALRFHLHHAVRAQRSDDGMTIALTLPDGVNWLFHADGLPVELEPSISFAVPEGARGVDQIVVQANAGQVSGINWVFQRSGA